MEQILILAYGNQLRGDDGVGWYAGEDLRNRIRRDEVEILCQQQLTPELAERISWNDAVIFVDAAGEGSTGEVQCERIDAFSGEAHFSHELTPCALLILARELYAATPLAYTVTVCGKNFEHGEELSAEVRDSMPKLSAEVERLVDELLMTHATSQQEKC